MRNASFCYSSIPGCDASLGKSRSESCWRHTLFCGLSYESLRESHRSARVDANPLARFVVLRFVQTSKRNLSLGEIVVSPLARCIFLRFVESIPKRRASLGETCSESLGKTPRSARFVINPYAKTSFCDLLIPRCNASLGESCSEFLGNFCLFWTFSKPLSERYRSARLL